MKSLFKSIVVFFLFSFYGLFGQSVTITFIETTDEHGAVFPFDFTDLKPLKSSLAQVYSFVKEERNKSNNNVILLSGGDILQGTPAAYYFNFEKTDTTHLIARVMNFMGYDAGAVGNHDIETGHNVYDKFNSELDFPWLAANAIEDNTGEPYFKPYTIIEKSGIKIAILGLITPHIPHWLPKNIWEGISWDDMIETADKWVKIIKEKDNPDLLVGLFHSGVDYTYGGQDESTFKNENASVLVARNVPGFDIIFVGHDHQGWNFYEKNIYGDSVLILGTTNSAREVAVGECILNYDANSKKWNKNIKGKIVNVQSLPPNEEFMSRFESDYNLIKTYVEKPIGTFKKELISSDAIFGPSLFTDFINSIQLELTGADISFTSALSLNAIIKEGEIIRGEMFKLYRYENLLYTMELTGQEIKDFLEYSYNNQFNQMKNENDHLINFVLDENGEMIFDRRNNTPQFKTAFFNFDCAAGINYTVDVSKPFRSKVNILSLSNGEKFDLNKKYNVAINSYRGNGGGGHLTRGAGIPLEELPSRIVTSTDKDLRYYIMNWISEKKEVYPQALNNWKIIPEDWWKKGKEKDKSIIFPRK